VLAALVGTVLLGQLLGAHEWAGIGVVVLADAAAVGGSRRAAPRRAPRFAGQVPGLGEDGAAQARRTPEGTGAR
jgi:hypothetical protein